MDVSDVEIKGNTITNDITTASEFKAVDIDVDSEGTGVEISGNKIYVSAAVKQTLVFLRNICASAENPARIYNNQVSGVGGVGSSSALKINGEKFANLDIAYNTFMMNGTASSSLVSIVHDAENINFVDNIFANRNDGVVIEFGGNLDSSVKFTSDVFESQGNNLISVAEAYKTFEEFTALQSVSGCFKENVQFFSNEVLSPVSKGSLLSAVPLAYVTTDITGAARNITTPTIGAYEYESSVSAPVIAKGFPEVRNVSASRADVAVVTDISGKVYVMAQKEEVAVPYAEEIK